MKKPTDFKLKNMSEDELIKMINKETDKVNRKLKGLNGTTDFDFYQKQFSKSTKQLNLSQKPLFTKSGYVSKSKALTEGKSKTALINHLKRLQEFNQQDGLQNVKSIKETAKVFKQQKMEKDEVALIKRRESFLDTMRIEFRSRIIKDYPNLDYLEVEDMVERLVKNISNGDENLSKGVYDNFLQYLDDNGVGFISEDYKEGAYNEALQYEEENKRKESEMKRRFYREQYRKQMKQVKNPKPDKPRYKRR